MMEEGVRGCMGMKIKVGWRLMDLSVRRWSTSSLLLGNLCETSLSEQQGIMGIMGEMVKVFRGYPQMSESRE